MKRREFLKASMAMSGLMGAVQTVVPATAADVSSDGREYYELRAYHLKDGASHDLLDAYLGQAVIPALNRLGVPLIGAFVEQEPKDGAKIWVLIPCPSLQSFGAIAARLKDDGTYQKAAAEYLASPKDKPAFDRIDSWLLLAFAGMPKLEQPSYSRDKKPRIFELRTYESHSESKALKKVEMFNSGEIDVMREVGLGPVFYGQALIGRDLPHLTYLLSGENTEAHKKHWGGFGAHPVWKKLKDDAKYADTVSKITSRFLAPTTYSQI